MSFQFDFKNIDPENGKQVPKKDMYEALHAALTSLLSAENDQIANLANASALIFSTLPDLNWAGFYLYKSNELVLGPFQGRLACTRIKIGRGVCGTAALKNETLVVPDVEAFPGHIACDSASRSELVVPISVAGELFGVLDVDSPILNRFDSDDKLGLETFVAILVQSLLPRG